MVAVLDLHDGAGLKADEVATLTDVVRFAAVPVLPRARFSVMTRDNILELLPPDTNLAQCVGDCEVETGRKLGADYVVVGDISKYGGELRAKLSVYDTKSAALIYGRMVPAKDLMSLERALASTAGLLFKSLVSSRSRRPPSAEVGEERSIDHTPAGEWEPDVPELTIVEFASDPPGAVVLVDGKLVCQDSALGCRKALSVGAHEVSMQKEGYLGRSEDIEVKAGLRVRWSLKPDFGHLSVTSEPGNLEVTVNKKSIGKSPVERHRLAPGSYEVLVTSPCFYGQGKRVVIKRGEHEQVAVAPKPRPAAVQVSAVDGRGNALKAEVYVDGQPVGRTPGTFKVNVCAREVEVRHERLEPWKQAVELRERTTTKVEAKFGQNRKGASGSVAWVTIDGGHFMMGSDKGDSDERPVRRVRVPTFQMARTEVTVAQYGACVKAGKCTEPDTGRYCNWGKPGRGEHPVNCVDWDQARAYAAWIGGRLPTEAEWEYAARSGGQAIAYPWGNEDATCERAIMDDGGDGCGKDRTWPVCSKSAGNTKQGLCDMAGNVWEWVEDWKGGYDEAPIDGSARTNGGGGRVIRGGGWSGTASGLRAAGRDSDDPAYRYGSVGFRPARSGP